MGKVSMPSPVQKIAIQKSSTLLGDTTIVEKSNISSPLNALEGRVGGVISIVETITAIRGIVTDIEGKPLSYTTLTLKGTSRATIADSTGRFIFEKVKIPSTLVVACVGFASKEIRIESNNEELFIRLEPQFSGEVIALAGLTISTRKSKKIKAKKLCMKAEVTTPVLTIYPNPIQRSSLLHLKWQNLDAGNYRIDIYNTAGAQMKSQKLILQKGLHETSIMINELSAGNYFVCLINEKNGKQLSEQFIVQE